MTDSEFYNLICHRFVAPEIAFAACPDIRTRDYRFRVEGAGLCHFDFAFRGFRLFDDGSENLGQLDVYLDRDDLSARKLVAQVDTVFSNSMVEAFNKKMKYEFLYRARLESIDDVISTLEIAVPEFNNRPHGALFGLTPNAVLAGARPDPGRFAAAIANGRRLRRQANRGDSCGVC